MEHRVERGRMRRQIHKRIRKRVQGTPERPRLAVYRSLKHIYTQIIDDSSGRTLVSASSVEKGRPMKTGADRAAAEAVGKEIAQRAGKAGIQSVIFDRGGHRFHGRVAALAAAARDGGLKF